MDQLGRQGSFCSFFLARRLWAMESMSWLPLAMIYRKLRLRVRAQSLSCWALASQKALSSCSPLQRLHWSSLTVSLSTSHRTEASSACSRILEKRSMRLLVLRLLNSTGCTPNPSPPLISRNPPKISSTASCPSLAASVSLRTCPKPSLVFSNACLVWRKVSKWAWESWEGLRVKKELRYLRERTAASVRTLSQRSMLGKCTSCMKRNSQSLGSLLQWGLAMSSLRYSPIKPRQASGGCFLLKVLLMSSTGITNPPYFSHMSCTRCQTCRNLRTVISMHSLLSARQLQMRKSCSFFEFSLLSFTSTRMRSSSLPFPLPSSAIILYNYSKHRHYRYHCWGRPLLTNAIPRLGLVL